MRRIVLDTETTGLEPTLGHRVIELACVELSDRRPTGRQFHRYLNPGRDSDPAALAVHGITTEFLADKPRFADIADDFLAFVDGAELLIHNAAFDAAFLDAELGLVQRPTIATVCGITDTLAMARELHPGRKNSLNALCERYGIDNSKRELHGALLDAQLLADVFLAMTRGQDTLDITLSAESGATGLEAGESRPVVLVVVRASEEERAVHARLCERIDKESKGHCLWKQAAGG
jgi:DNA polymerase III subunit epsilon